MNFFEKYNNDFIIKNIDYSLCKKLTKNINNESSNTCVNFLKDKENVNTVKMCPYGFTCIFGNNTVLCGFAHSSHMNEKKIKGHTRNGHKGNVIIFNDEEFEQAKELKEIIDYCLLASATTHDLRNSIGQLKSLLETEKKRNLDEKGQHIYSSLEKYSSLSNSYQDNSKCLDDRFFITDLTKLDNLVSYWTQKRAIYDKFLDGIIDSTIELDSYIKSNIKESDYKGNKFVLGMLSMASMFSYRIEIYLLSYNNSFGLKNNDNHKQISMNPNKAFFKLTSTLRYHAIKKQVRFKVNTCDDKWIKCYKNLYLAFYIILENAVKYSPFNTFITINIKNNDLGFDIYVINDSKEISSKVLQNISKKGISGENARGAKSHGLGLYSVQKIMDENNCPISYQYENNKFIVKMNLIDGKIKH